MTDIIVTYAATAPESAACLIPGGIRTPYGTSVLEGAVSGRLDKTSEATTKQEAYILRIHGGLIDVSYRFATDRKGPYPDAMFSPRDNRFTRFADSLAAEVTESTGGRTTLERARAIACHTAERFTYGHPEARFNDGLDAVPALGCGLTEGSCVDINTYFIAALRSAGIEAGYLTGFFFPEEKQRTCDDGHCWVVTRIGGMTQEWDIAHHLKLGTRDIWPGLNPKRGERIACFHSMGLDFPVPGVDGLKALIEPVAILDGDVLHFDAPKIRFSALKAFPV